MVDVIEDEVQILNLAAVPQIHCALLADSGVRSGYTPAFDDILGRLILIAEIRQDTGKPHTTHLILFPGFTARSYPTKTFSHFDLYLSMAIAQLT